MNRFKNILYRISYFLPFTISFFYSPMMGAVSIPIHDAGLWTNITLERRVSSLVSLALSTEARLNENISELGTLFTEGGITYRLSGNLRIAAYYRFIQRRRQNNSYSTRHRYYLDISYRKRIGDFIPIGRLRVQTQYQDIFSSQDGTIPVWYVRGKATIRYNMPGPWNPYLSAEIFYHITQTQFDNIRYIVGIERNITKSIQLDIGFLHQQEFNVVRPVYDYVFLIGCTYSL